MRRALFVVLLLLPFMAHSEQFQRRELIVGSDTLRYRILMPENFSEKESYPVLFFLHGAGERGSDNERQLTWGSAMFLDEAFRSDHPAIVIFPQCPENSAWFDLDSYNTLREDVELASFNSDIPQSATSRMLDNLIDSTLSWRYSDKERYYIMGLSMGSFGTFELMSRRPDLFKAAVPICGGGVLNDADKYGKKVAFWIFHGDKDNVVTVEHSRKMYQKLKSIGADVKYTEFEGVNHGSWTPAFATEGLMDWVFSK